MIISKYELENEGRSRHSGGTRNLINVVNKCFQFKMAKIQEHFVDKLET